MHKYTKVPLGKGFEVAMTPHQIKNSRILNKIKN